MEIQGVFSQDIINKNTTLSLLGVRNVQLINNGTATVTVGKYKVLQPGDTMYFGEGVTFVNKTPLSVQFSKTGSKNLYVAFTKIQNLE